MSYSDRVTLITYKVTEGFLGDEITEEIRTVVPCYRGRLTNNQQMGIFGKYNLSAFKLHLQGIHKEIEEIEYEGVKRSVKGTIYHRNSTVVVVE